MDEQIKASGARLEHVATLDRHIATRSDFDRALLDKIEYLVAKAEHIDFIWSQANLTKASDSA